MKISEAAFMAQVKAIAYTYGWLLQHSTPTQTAKGRWLTSGSAGYPDLCLAHPERGLVFAELKSDTGRVSHAQIAWYTALDPWVECYIWRPQDLPEITARLGRPIDRRSG